MWGSFCLGLSLSWLQSPCPLHRVDREPGVLFSQVTSREPCSVHLPPLLRVSCWPRCAGSLFFFPSTRAVVFVVCHIMVVTCPPPATMLSWCYLRPPRPVRHPGWPHSEGESLEAPFFSNLFPRQLATRSSLSNNTREAESKCWSGQVVRRRQCLSRPPFLPLGAIFFLWKLPLKLSSSFACE